MRPSYPARLRDEVLGFAGLEPAPQGGEVGAPGSGPPASLLEIGAGTGKATALFAESAAAAGWRLTCVEPDPEMASLLERKLRPYGRLSWQLMPTSFEQFASGSSERFDLVYAAQSWHWMKAESRVRLAASLLRPGRCLALLWNIAFAPEPELVARLERAYSAALGDDVAAWRERLGPLYCLPAAGRADPGVARYVAEIDSSKLFGPVTLSRSPWSRTYASHEWLSLLQTQSDHRMLEAERLREVVSQVGRVLDASGGTITIGYEAVAVLSTRR